MRIAIPVFWHKAKQAKQAKGVIGADHWAKLLAFDYPTEGKNGRIKLIFDGQPISAEVQEVQGNENVGQFSPLENKVFVEQAMPKRRLPWLSLHEAIERTLDRIGIPWQIGHNIAEREEKKAFFAAGHTPAEWRDYSREVDNVHKNVIDARTIKGGRTVYMSPQEFLEHTPSMDTSAQSAAQQKASNFPRDTITYLKKKMRAKEWVGTPFIDFNHYYRNWPLYDGRSRAQTAKELGIQKIPVKIFGKGGKLPDNVDLEKAYDLLLAKQRQVKWGMRGIDNLLKEEVGDYELKKLERELNYHALEEKYGDHRKVKEG